MEEGNQAVRLRTHEGSVTATHADDGSFKGDGWTFYPTGANGIALAHKDKIVAKNCRKES